MFAWSVCRQYLHDVVGRALAIDLFGLASGTRRGHENRIALSRDFEDRVDPDRLSRGNVHVFLEHAEIAGNHRRESE